VTPPEPIVSLRDLTRRYVMGNQPIAALDGLTLDIPAGQFLGIVGRSGSGKSTLLNLLGGLDSPTGGTIRVGGMDLAGAGSDTLAQYRSRKVGFIFQQFHLVPSMTALQNVALPLVFAGVPHAERRTRALALLERVGLAARSGHRPAELSGGEQQRVAIARALVNAPAILLADEPTGNLDSTSAAAIADLLRQAHRAGQTIILVTHDRAMAESLCSRTVELRDGRLIADSAAPGSAA